MEYTISEKAKKVTLGVAVVGLVLLVIGFFSQKDFVYAKKINDHAVSIKYNGKAGSEQQDQLKEEIKRKMSGYEIVFHDATHSSHYGNGHHSDSHDEDIHHSDSRGENTLHLESHGEDIHHSDSHGENTRHLESHGVNVKYQKNISNKDQKTEYSTLNSTIDNGHGHSNTHESEDSHAHHGPTFVWDVHLNHSKTESHLDNHSESGADKLISMVNDGEIAFADKGNRRFWSNLLVNGFFFFGIALGALFYLALHYATESGWGVVLLRVFEGIMSAMPIGIVVLLIVFIVGTFGGHHIYPWMDPEYTDPNSSHFDPIIYGKKAYLNLPFFWIRVVAYFTTFYLFLKWFKKKSRQEDIEGGTESHFKMYRRGALFLVFFAVFSSTMAWDFIMSIDTHWFSTLFGWYVFSGIWLSGMIMVMMITLYLRKKGYLPYVNESHIHDVGKWMFALSFLWSYLWFSQFMLIWYSNIPEEVIYFTQRIENYNLLFFGTFIVNFFFPMVFFMSRDTKRSAGFLIVIGLMIFIGHWFDVFNMVMPGTLFDQWELGLLELGMFMLFLGTFVYTALRAISKAPLLQKNHPYLEESKYHEF